MRRLTASAATVLALAVAIPAFAGGAHCGGGKEASTTSAEAASSCGSSSKSAAWTGAWLQRTEAGKVTVAEVAKGSPAARSGLRAGDLVLAVNGYDLSNSKERAMCESSAECKVGSAVTYKVQRGRSTKSVRCQLEQMPSTATARFANRQASFEPALAAVVMPVVN